MSNKQFKKFVLLTKKFLEYKNNADITDPFVQDYLLQHKRLNIKQNMLIYVIVYHYFKKNENDENRIESKKFIDKFVN